MKIKIAFLLIFSFLTIKSFSQEHDVAKIQGTILFSKKGISDIHIVNLSNYLGTISNDLGLFEITCKLNDTLLFSSIEFETKKIKINHNHIKNKSIFVEMTPQVTALNEVFLKGLTGNLAYDSKNNPTLKSPKHNFAIKPNDFNKKLAPDIHGFKDAPFAGPASFKPLPATAIIPNFQLEKELKLKRELARKKNFPIAIRNNLGMDFFTKNLKIPEDKIDHFLDYCEYRNIINLYHKNELLQLIEILTEESISYNLLKN